MHGVAALVVGWTAAVHLLVPAFRQDGERLVATIPDGVQAGFVMFSDDGKTAAYGARKGDQLWLVVGEWKSKPSPFPKWPVLLANGKDFIYADFAPPTPAVYFNEEKLFETGSVRDWAWRLPGAVSPDGKVVVNDVQHRKSGKSGVAINGKVQELHAGTASPPVLSADGKVFAFALEKEDGHCIVVNDRPGPLFDWVTQPALSADGKVVSYGAEAGEEFVLVQGDRKTPVKLSPKGVFQSPDGKSLGYWGAPKKAGGKPVHRGVVGGREGPEFAEIQLPVFSPDARHVTYRAKKADGTWCVVVDDRTFEVPEVQSNPVFMAGDGRVGFGIRKGNELRWKTIEVR